MLRNTEKKEKIRNAHCRTCNLSRNLKKWKMRYKNSDLEYGGKHSKTFEIRKNDRNFKVGDRLMLYEINSKTKQKTGRVLEVQVTYITDYAQKEDYVVMATRLKIFKDPVHVTVYE